MNERSESYEQLKHAKFNLSRKTCSSYTRVDKVIRKENYSFVGCCKIRSFLLKLEKYFRFTCTLLLNILVVIIQKSTFIFVENGKIEVSEKPKANPRKTLLERWEESLMSSTNLAQVFIHLSSLDNCVSWDKSVLNARCKICRRKGDAEHMLLCDGCDRGHHMYCLKPPIKQVRWHITLLNEKQSYEVHRLFMYLASFLA